MPHFIITAIKAEAPAGKVARTMDAEIDMDSCSAPVTPHDAAASMLSPAKVELDTLFDDDEDIDDDFPSSSPSKSEALISSSPQPVSPTNLLALKASDPEVLRSFYQRLFPWRQLFQWLNHSPTPAEDFKHREFAFTLQNDAYLRYQAFATADLLRKDVLRLMPARFEIGPVYNTNPRDRKSLRNVSSFRPLAKELCFDIDLTDYDDVRTCCDKASICTKCWTFITIAIKVVDAALRDDFGFCHILWVYSGRRGAHAWICDRKARGFDDHKRRAISGYLEVVRGGAQSGKKINVRRPLHPHLSRSLDILKTHFLHDVLQVQDPWASNEQAEKLLQLLPDRNFNESLRRKWDAAPGRASASKWADIDAMAKTGASKHLNARALLEAKQDIVLEYTYPRLDIEVSKKLNHLLKSPFVVHPATGRVCVPIDPCTLDTFDPLAVPTVQALLAEIDAWKGGDDGSDCLVDRSMLQKNTPDWEKTSLKPYVDYFRSFVIAMIKEERAVRAKREREEESIEF